MRLVSKHASALFIVLALLVASLAPITSLARIAAAENQATTTNNSTNVSSSGYGIVIALRISVNNVEALFKTWGVPNGSELWEKLSEINESIAKVEELVKQGKINEARVLAAKLFKQLGLLVAEAAQQYARRVAGNTTEKALVIAEINRLAAMLRATLAALNATLHRVDATIRWAAKANVTACNNVVEELRSLKKELSESIAKGEELLNETLALKRLVIQGNITADEARKQVKELGEEIRDYVKDSMELVKEARIEAAKPHFCKAREELEKIVEKLRERIENLTEEAKKLREQGREDLAKRLEKRAEILERMLQRYESMLNETTGKGFRGLGPGEIFKIIKIRHMLPSPIKDIIGKRFHILPIPLPLPPMGLDKALVKLKMTIVQLRAMKYVVPSDLRDQYNETLAALATLADKLEAYKHNETSKEDVLKAAQAALKKLDDLKEVLRERKAGKRALAPLIHLVDMAEQQVKTIMKIIGGGEAHEEKPALTKIVAKRMIEAAQKSLEAAKRLAEIKKDDDLVKSIEAQIEELSKAKEALEEGNTAKAQTIISNVVSVLKNLEGSLDGHDWITLRIRILIGQASITLEALLALIS
ncbi:hypothetical protein PYJP_12370 [Pyrofollis japonicus]|uniref:hypothetical protein n=1 Tax=Pyrofollis japonicus TaxID=3060460 RepID=UPI00295B17BB|nr:hypothetical protein [Pyrofollis japonicus]BEP17885.1 hypothetical protein PYJP_12370 [Pyrofollis japonicus]